MTSLQGTTFKGSLILSFLLLGIVLVIVGVLIVNIYQSGVPQDNQKSFAVSSSLLPLSPTTNYPLPPTTFPSREKAQVSYVIDGDTFVLKNGKRVRLIGIDAAEVQTYSTLQVEKLRHLSQCFGKEAKDFLTVLVGNQTVELERDVSETDSYNRLLRYVYQDNVFINLLLVSQGFAKTLSIPPDTRFANQFQAAQQEAQTHTRGFWKLCQ